ncbi:MAG: VOC family protein [Methylococcales bacterium]|nr:VOC family protein [Methylococcales bacterium]
MHSTTINFLRIDHHSVISSDIEKSKFFYHNIIGLEIDLERPPLKYDGAWFKVTEDTALHCLCLPNYDPVKGRPEHGGHDRHVALKINDLSPLISQLDKHAIFYSRSISGRQAIFFRDPDGNAIEVIEN